MHTHIHRPEWNKIKLQMDDILRDPRFWAVLVLIVLFGLMVLTALFTKQGSGTIPVHPFYMP